MRYLGVDPGYSRAGWGIVEDLQGELKMIKCGVIKTSPDTPFPERLSTVLVNVSKLLADHNIDVLGVEHPIHGQNVTNSVEVGAAYGAVLLAGVAMRIPILIHFPTQVKAAVANGRASKAEVKHGVETILRITLKGHDDESDGLAVAICTHDNYRLAEMVNDL